MAIPKVILIGGAPFVGKSATARCLSSRYQYGCISTDDITKAVGCLTTKATHPGLHITENIGYREYFSETPAYDLISHAQQTREVIWPAIEVIIRTHADWGDPIVVEGYALWPEHAHEADFADTGAILLSCDRELLERRIRSQSSFYQEAPDPEKLIANVLQRSIRYNQLMIEACLNCGGSVITVEAYHSVDDVADLCVSAMTRE